SPLNSVLVTGSIQAVARFTSQRDEEARSVQRAGLRMHLRVGLPIAAAFVLAAPLVAGWMQDADKTGPLMLAGLIPLGYASYAGFVGTSNGLRNFRTQAGLAVSMATLRAGRMLGLAALGLGLYGVISGWIIATAIILIVSSVVVGLPGRSREVAPRPLGPMIG